MMNDKQYAEWRKERMGMFIPGGIITIMASLFGTFAWKSDMPVMAAIFWFLCASQFGLMILLYCCIGAADKCRKRWHKLAGDLKGKDD